MGTATARTSPAAGTAIRTGAKSPARTPRPPLVINIGRPSSGGPKHNYPSQEHNRPREGARPSWGHVNGRPAIADGADASEEQAQPQPAQPRVQRPAQAGLAQVPGIRSASVTHHHAYTVGCVRKRLQKLGVTQEPGYITERSEIIHTDRTHSGITYPATGPDGAALNVPVLAPHRQDGAAIRTRMQRVDSADWQAKVVYNDRTERSPAITTGTATAATPTAII